MKKVTAKEIASWVGGVVVHGDEQCMLSGVADLKQANATQLSFLANPKYEAFLEETGAGAVLVRKGTKANTKATLIEVENPDEAFSVAVQRLLPPEPTFPKGIHPTAVIAENVTIGEEVHIGANVVIESGAVIGAQTCIHAGAYIGHEVRIGVACTIFPNVVIRHRVILGDRVVIHPASVIGSDGFGFVADASGSREKIPQLGNVEIGNDVEIGAQVAIDRARFGVTRIGHGVKIDNLVQIAHNVIIEDHAVIVSQVGISGSTHIGSKAILAGQVGVAGHLHIGEGALVLARAGVTKDVPPGTRVVGYPAKEYKQFAKLESNIKKIPTILARLKKLEK